MNYRHAVAVVALTLGLAGCSTYSDSYGLRYDHGSYYSPGDAGYGDYYFAPEPRYDYYNYYDPFFYGSRYDSYWGLYFAPAPRYYYHRQPRHRERRQDPGLAPRAPQREFRTPLPQQRARSNPPTRDRDDGDRKRSSRRHEDRSNQQPE